MRTATKVFATILIVGLILCSAPMSESLGIVMSLLGGVGFIVTGAFVREEES